MSPSYNPSQSEWHLLLAPGNASNFSGPSDALFFMMVAVCGAVTLLITLTMIYFCIRYRAGSKADRSGLPSKFVSHLIEVGWIVPTVVIFLVFFVWGAVIYMRMYTPPAGPSVTINVQAKQWMWKFEHFDGTREIDTLHVPVNRTVRLKMTSIDVIHSLYVPAFRIKHDVLPDTYSWLWFKATKTGSFPIYCTQYCGTNHSLMKARVVVMQPAQYQDWLNRQSENVSPAILGKRLFRAYGCSGCHVNSETVHAPNLAGIYGKPVPLKGGGTVIADDAYLRDSILFPKKDIAAGYKPIMPQFNGRISDAELQNIVAYIRSLTLEDQETP